MKALHRPVQLVVVAVMVCGMVPTAHLFAQSNARAEILRSEGDGFPIHITYYPALKDAVPGGVQDASVILLLPGETGSRLIFDKTSAPPNGDPLAIFLQKQGHAVISVDLRKHGESVLPDTPNMLHPDDYAKMVIGDLAAVKNFLFEEHQAKRLNMAKTGLFAADDSCAVALAFAEADWLAVPYDDAPIAANRTPRGQDVKALCLMSPTLSSGRLQALKAAQFLKAKELGIAFMIWAGTQDPKDKNAASSLFNAVSFSKKFTERAYFERPVTKSRGTDLLANPAARPEAKIIEFFDKHLKALNIPWQDRRSRLDRD